MRRAGLLALLALGLLGADCIPPDPGVARRSAAIELHVARPRSTPHRSQDAGVFTWDGTSRLHFVGSRDAADVEAEVAAGSVAGQMCVFLDGPGTLVDTSGWSASDGSFLTRVVPSVYDVLVAPDCLTGARASARFLEAPLPSFLAEPLEWPLPAGEDIQGEVVDALGRPVRQAVVTLYRPGSPQTPLGISTLTDDDGFFLVDAEPGTYTVVVSANAEGWLPDEQHPTIPPLRTTATLDPDSPVRLRLRVPSLQTVRVRGTLTERTGTLTAGRIRFEGYVAPLLQPGAEYPGGTFRAELFTDDGTWEVDLPPGAWTATSWPPHAGATPDARTGQLPLQDQDRAELEFELSGGEGVLEDVELRFTDATLATLFVEEPDGGPAAGDVSIWRVESPHYAYRYPLSGGRVTVQLMAGTYDVDVHPARTSDGQRRFPRGHGHLDLTAGPRTLTVRLPRGDPYQARVVDGSGEGLGDLRVVARDEETGRILDDSLTAPNGVRGYYGGLLPRPGESKIFESDPPP